MIGVIKGTMRQKKEVTGLPLPIASYKTQLKAPIRSLKVAITAKQSGSGTPSPDNERPIIGASECNVVRCGKNLFPYSTMSVYSYSFAVNQNFNQMVNPIFLKGGKTYTLSLESGEKIYRLRAFNSSKELITNPTEINMTSGSSGVLSYYSNYKFFGYSGTPNNVNLIQPTNDIWLDIVTQSNASTAQLELGSTATAYEAYTGNTYTIQLGDTYYGGFLDVTTGELTVDKKGRYVDSELSISYDETNQRFFVTLPDMANNTSARNKVILCSTYENKVNVPYVTSWDNVIYNAGGDRPKDIAIHDRRYTTVADFVAYTSQNCFIVYPLATPVNIQLTPTQVEQLLGANNVWADTGDVEELIYTDRQVYYGR